jgi:hypothetical protein
MARFVALAIVAALAAAPAMGAVAIAADPQPNPFLPAPEPTGGQEPVPQEAPVVPTTSQDDGRIGDGTLVLLLIGAGGLLGGIWVVISRDARRATAGRVGPRDGALEAAAARGSRAPARSRKVSPAERRRRKRGRAR